MSTCCLTVVKSRYNDNDVTLASIYRHWDGYPEGHGKYLRDFLRDVTLINGICSGTPENYANGVDHLAAKLVCKMQNDGHDPKLTEQGADAGQEFEYHVTGRTLPKPELLEIVVYSGPMTFFGLGGEECTNEIFRGNLDEYSDWLDKME